MHDQSMGARQAARAQGCALIMSKLPKAPTARVSNGKRPDAPPEDPPSRFQLRFALAPRRASLADALRC